MRIGIFGGTFDPPHIAHLIIAEQARQQLRLHKVLFVPAHDPPHKKGKAWATPAQRLAMLKLATSGVRGFEVSSIEIGRKGLSYTVDTLHELKSKFKNADFFLIVGGDNFAQLDSWKSVEEILRMATPVVYERDHGGATKTLTNPPTKISLHGPLLKISSTMIRERVRDGVSIRFLVPAAVESYIQRHKLYQKR